jgi:hypothetical protein
MGTVITQHLILTINLREIVIITLTIPIRDGDGMVEMGKEIKVVLDKVEY